MSLRFFSSLLTSHLSVSGVHTLSTLSLHYLRSIVWIKVHLLLSVADTLITAPRHEISSGSSLPFQPSFLISSSQLSPLNYSHSGFWAMHSDVTSCSDYSFLLFLIISYLPHKTYLTFSFTYHPPRVHRQTVAFSPAFL